MDQTVFANVKRAAIVPDHGVPKLTINGKPVLPYIFFYNTSLPMEFLAPQVKAAAENGVHIYSMDFVGWSWLEEGETGEGNFSGADALLDAFIKNDPKATFILRFYTEGGAKLPPDEEIVFASGAKGGASVASDYSWKSCQRNVARMIRHYEASPYGPRILAYHACGQSEWFGNAYREEGADYSKANLRAFQAWLKNQYKTDAALAAAWSKPGLTFDKAQIPPLEKGRFPVPTFTSPSGKKIHVFYDPQKEKDWVDFSRYTNEAVSQRIMDIAKLIKKETGGKKLTLFFFGYTFDLPSSINGHIDIERLLNCPDVDMFASPLSYWDRMEGGSAGFMSVVDSITAHGKLWINEDDMRTHLMTEKLRGPDGKFNPISIPTKNLEETSWFLQRNLSALIVHRTGTWWMDLCAWGAFNDPSLWKIFTEKGNPLYSEIYAHPTPYRPEVAIVIDPRAQYNVKYDADFPDDPLHNLRDLSLKTGAQTGYYFLNDFIDGSAPRCKVYFFANAFYLTDAQVEAINKRLDREKATAIWQYAPGYLGPKGINLEQAAKLTGMQLAANDGRLMTEGEGLLKGLQWGSKDIVSPRLIVADKEAEVLGRYAIDKTISTARKKSGSHTSIFTGDFWMSSEMLKAIFKEAGVHIWTSGNEIVHTDGNILAVHTGQAGIHKIFSPAGKKLEPFDGKIDSQSGDTISVAFKAGETRWFRIMPR